MAQTVDKGVIIADLIRKGIRAYEEKTKDGPPFVHEHTTPELAQVCLVCRGVSKPNCMPKFTEPVSLCQARNIIFKMVQVKISV